MPPADSPAGLALRVLAVPGAVWALSYLHLAVHHRKLNLWSSPVHESGRLTLLETVFYFNHFLRELPVVTLYALSIHWSYEVIRPGFAEPPPLARGALIQGAFWGFLALAVAGSCWRVGLRATLLDLFQLRDRDESCAWGAHWQMHFLSTVALIILLLLPGTCFDPAEAGPPFLVLGLFAALSLLFGTGRRAVTDVRWLLHGGREIITFGLLVAAPAYLTVAGELLGPRAAVRAATIAAAAALVLLAVYYLRVLRRHRIRDHAERDLGTLYLLSSHFFEHVLDVVFMTLLLLLLLGRPGG